VGLKSALFEMKDILEKDQKDVVMAHVIRNLEIKNQLNTGLLDYYFNILMILKAKHSKKTQTQTQNQNHTKKINRKWINCEIELMFQYINDRQEETSINITELLEEVAQLLNRGYQSVNYKYYTLVKEKEQEIGQKDYKFMTISQMDVPVISTELIQRKKVSEIEVEKQDEENDLLDLLSGLITNVQELPGIQLTELLSSLYHLTSLAIGNQKGNLNIENIQQKASLDNELLREKLFQKEQQLIQEKKRNDELQAEVNRLAAEISAFSKLGDAAKIQNLKSYNQKLNSIIDKTGFALQIGS
jgi:hypothetical protein